MFSTGKIVENGIKALDSAFFTDEERSTYMLKYMEATKPQAISRRFIAMIVSMLWCLGILFCGVLLYIDSPKFEVMKEFMNETVNEPFMVVLTFYFLAHVVSRSK